MDSLRRELEGIVQDKVEPLSIRVSSLESKVTELKKSVAKVEEAASEFEDDFKLIDERVFQKFEKKFNKITAGMKKLDRTNFAALDGATKCGDMINDLKAKYDRQETLRDTLVEYVQEVQEYLIGKMNNFENGNLENDAGGTLENLEEKASTIRDLLHNDDETASYGDLQDLLEEDEDGLGKLI